MKIKIIILFIFASQLVFSQGFKGGLFAGMVASQLDGDNSDGYHKFGFQGGVYSRYIFSDRLSLINELKFIQKGSSRTNDDDPYSNFKVKLNYIELPFILDYQVKEKIAIGGGISYGYLISAEVEDGAGVIPKEDLPYNNSDIDAILHVKYLFNDNFWISTKFAYSILYITKTTPRQSNNLISLELGYEF